MSYSQYTESIGSYANNIAPHRVGLVQLSTKKLGLMYMSVHFWTGSVVILYLIYFSVYFWTRSVVILWAICVIAGHISHFLALMLHVSKITRPEKNKFVIRLKNLVCQRYAAASVKSMIWQIINNFVVDVHFKVQPALDMVGTKH